MARAARLMVLALVLLCVVITGCHGTGGDVSGKLLTVLQTFWFAVEFHYLRA
jgi:predicted small secreted protein